MTKEKEFITQSSKETQKLGKILAQELYGGEIICLTGELGAGKTTFTQGLLSGLEVEGPYTSPTFVIMKHYKKQDTGDKEQGIKNIYHIDAYRVSSHDIIDLGWEEIVSGKNNIIIVEWAERIADIIPKNALQINFQWINEDKRKITFKSKL
jgi:tRNA threonylcarbamoyladenosine biosynthesis protein TsaE